VRFCGAVVLVACAGCGFRTLPGGDGGEAADLAGVDLAGADLAGVDLAGVDLAGGDLSTPPGGGFGPGPLGALPAGYCCSDAHQCRGRLCNSDGGGAHYCSQTCMLDAECTDFGAPMRCDRGSSTCVFTSTPYTCLDPQSYAYGGKPLGSCCASGFPTAGQACLGGLCFATGNDVNPYYCTQGCVDSGECPPGYGCHASFCWKEQSFLDPNYVYTCQ
jgi:hypothetical protein